MKHPHVELTLELNDRRVDAAAEGYDAVVRHGPLEDTRLTVWRLAVSQRVLVASPDYLARHGTPSSVADLQRHRAIHYTTGGPREIADRPFDYEALKAAYRAAGGKGAWMVNNGYDKPLAEEAVKEGDDLVAFGKPFISNPDLVRRLRENAPLNELDKATMYGGGAKGYTDYPALA